MKKILSTFVLLLIALTSISASAQSSKVVGTWVGGKQPIPGYNADMVPVYVFSNGGTGAVAIGVSFNNFPIDETMSLNVEMILSAPLTWSYSNASVSYNIDLDECNLEVSDLSINTSNYQLKQTFESIKPQMIEMLTNEFRQSIVSSIPSYGRLTNIKFSGNKMYANDGSNGPRMTFTRSK